MIEACGRGEQVIRRYVLIKQHGLNERQAKEKSKRYRFFMLDLIRRYASLYFAEILGFSLMGDRFHILVRTIP